MKFSFLLGFVFIIQGDFAKAQRVWDPCARSFHEDSAGRGIEYGFRRTGGRPVNNSEACFQRGEKLGRELKSQDPSDGCVRDFDAGFREAFWQKGPSASTLCFGRGREAGAAWLRSNAREARDHVVGKDCVAQYKRGFMTSVYVPGSLDTRGQTCYDTGFYDQAFLRGP